MFERRCELNTLAVAMICAPGKVRLLGKLRSWTLATHSRMYPTGRFLNMRRTLCGWLMSHWYGLMLVVRCGGSALTILRRNTLQLCTLPCWRRTPRQLSIVVLHVLTAGIAPEALFALISSAARLTDSATLMTKAAMHPVSDGWLRLSLASAADTADVPYDS